MDTGKLGTRALFHSTLVAVALGFAGVAEATVLTLQPDDGKDAQLANGSLSGSNFGTHPDLITNWVGNLRSIGLIEFDLSSLPSGAPVNSATLSLFHETNSCLGCRYDVFRVTSAWDESTVTFDTAPSFDATAVASLLIGDAGTGVFRDWDVTSVVQGWATGSFSNFGLWIEEIPVQGSSVAYFSSSDSGGASTDPILRVTVPEPASLALLLVGFAGLGFARKRRAC